MTVAPTPPSNFAPIVRLPPSIHTTATLCAVAFWLAQSDEFRKVLSAECTTATDAVASDALREWMPWLHSPDTQAPSGASPAVDALLQDYLDEVYYGRRAGLRMYPKSCFSMWQVRLRLLGTTSGCASDLWCGWGWVGPQVLWVKA